MPAPGEGARFGLLVVSHGDLAFELVRALERIVGQVDHVRALPLNPSDDLAGSRGVLQKAIEEVDPGGGVLILTDMFGGSATNLTLPLLRDGIEILTGANLPMLVKYANIRTSVTLKEAVARIKEQGQRSIAIATEYLEPGQEG